MGEGKCGQKKRQIEGHDDEGGWLESGSVKSRAKEGP